MTNHHHRHNHHMLETSLSIALGLFLANLFTGWYGAWAQRRHERRMIARIETAMQRTEDPPPRLLLPPPAAPESPNAIPWFLVVPIALFILLSWLASMH